MVGENVPPCGVPLTQPVSFNTLHIRMLAPMVDTALPEIQLETATAPEEEPTRPLGNVVKRRVLIVDDHPIFRDGISQLINYEPDLQVCGGVASAPPSWWQYLWAT